MGKSSAGLSNIQKFLISLSVIFIVVILDYRSFLDKYRTVEYYDDLNFKISSVRVSITKLEYLLDMYVVARRFENTTIDIIKGDVREIDDSIKSIRENPRFREITATNAPLGEGVSVIIDDWQTITDEIKRLNAAMSQDEIILLHNAVDMNTILVTEKAERLLGVIAQSRKTVFYEIKSLALKTSIAFILLMLLASLAYYRRVIAPTNSFMDIARRVAAGDLFMRFRHRAGSITGRLGGELNAMLDSITESQIAKEKENKELRGELDRRSQQLSSILSLMASAGRSLSQGELFSSAVREASLNGASAAAIYLFEGGELRLKAASGFDDIFIRESSVIPADELGSLRQDESVTFSEESPYLFSRYWKAFTSAGFTSLLCVPMRYNMEARGYFLAAFRSEAAGVSRLFIEAMSAGISASAGHVNLFQKELGSRRFLERIFNQMPLGVAVFEKDGRCVFLNTQIKRLIGADQKFNNGGEYLLFEDQALASQGAVSSIKKSLDGYMAELTINYDPSLNSGYNFDAPARRLKLKSLPLYDSGGEISGIMLLCEDLTNEALSAGENLK